MNYNGYIEWDNDNVVFCIVWYALCSWRIFLHACFVLQWDFYAARDSVTVLNVDI